MNKEIKVIYFHGYGSSSASDKVVALREYFEDVFAPDIPLEWDKAEVYLKDFCSKLLNKHTTSFVFAGTSLGGYWATRMSDYFGVPSVIINPSVTPATTLQSYRNPALTIPELIKYIPLTPENRSPRTVLLAMDDEVLNPQIAAKFFKFADVKFFSSGGHRFNSINIIRDNIIEIANLDYLSDDNI